MSGSVWMGEQGSEGEKRTTAGLRECVDDHVGFRVNCSYHGLVSRRVG